MSVLPEGATSPVLLAGTMPPTPLIYLAFCVGPTFYMPPTTLIRRPDDMLSLPLRQHILDYEPPQGFVIPAFATFDGSANSYDHMLHYNQAMILNADNDRLLCKVFPASLRGPVLAWFHKLPRNSINSFNDLWEAFVSQYLNLVRQKRNISSLQTIPKQEEEFIQFFTTRFGQAVQQIESYSMNAVLQNFRRSFEPSTPFFQSQSLDPPATMEELYRQADQSSMLEDNIRAATQTVMTTNQPAKGNKSSESKNGQSRDRKQSRDQSQKKRELPQFTPLNISYERLLPIIHDLLEFKWPTPIQTDPSQRNESL